MSSTRTILSKVSKLNEDLNLLDYQIFQLETFGQAMINNNFHSADLIMETLPNNGVRPLITPLFPAPQPLMENDLPEGEVPQPVGFHRVYSPTELKNNPIMTIFMELDKKVVLGLVDLAILRLKEQKKHIFQESRQMLKPGK